MKKEAGTRTIRVPDVVDPYFFVFDWRVPGLSPFLRRWFVGAATIVHQRAVFDVVGYWNTGISRFGDREFSTCSPSASATAR